MKKVFLIALVTIFAQLSVFAQAAWNSDSC